MAKGGTDVQQRAGHRRMGTGTLRAAGLLHVVFSSLLLAAEGQPTGIDRGVRCLNNYGFLANRRVDCTWRWNQSLGEGPFYLSFSDTFKQLSDVLCRLSPSNNTREELSCSAEGPGDFEENDKYEVYLHDASLEGKVVFPAWEEGYDPMRNIKCDPPYDIRSNMSSSGCLIEWKMPEEYRMIWDDMQWQLQFRATHVPWEQAENKTVVSRETSMEIDGSEFTPGTSYIARVRCKTPNNDDAYVSQWSEWSTTTEWNIPQGPLPRDEWLVLRAVFISVPLGLGALLLLLLLAGSYSRVKSQCAPSTPTPAAFFLPLYSSHNGNFQAWIGIKKQDVSLRGGDSTDPGKAAGPGPVEPISPLSSFKRRSAVELPAEEGGCHLHGAPEQQDKASNYVVMQGETQALLLPGRAPLHLEGPPAAAECFPYLPYKNTLLFVEQELRETGILSSCSRASCSEGPGPCSSGEPV